MTKKEILEMTKLSEEEFYRQYPTEESWTESYKKGGWIQKATASIKRRGTEGVCTGSKFGGPTCRPGTKRYNLAKTFRKMAKSRKEEGGYVDMYEEGGKIPDSVLRSRLESHMSPAEAQDYIDSYGEGGMVDAYQLMGMPTPAMYAIGGNVMMEDYARGGMIKRKDGSYSRRGLWDNIRANRGSGKKPTAEMLKQERKIRAAEKKEYGGMVNMYDGGDTVAESSSTAGAQAQARFMYDKAMQMPNRGMIYATPDAVNPNDYALATMSGYTGSDPRMVKQAADRTKKQVAPMAAGIAGAPLLSSSMATVGNLLARPFINTPGLSWLNANKVLDAHMLHAFADRAPEWTAAFEKAYASGSEKDLKELAKITTLQAIDVSPVLEIGHLKNAPAAMKKIVDTLSPFAKTSKLFTEGKSSAKVVEHGLKEGTKHQADTTKKKAMGGPVMYGMGGTTNIGDLSHVISAKNFPNMGYAMGGPVMYDFGSVVKDIGAGLYGAGEGLLDTVTMGATDQLTDQGYKGLQKLGGSSESEMRQQDSIRGYGMAAGAITGGILNPASAASAIQQGAKGVGMGVSKGSPNSKFAQGVGTYLPMAGNLAGMAAGAGAFGNIGGGAAGSAQSAEFAKSGFGQFAQGAGQVGKGYNQFGGMMGGNPMSMLGMFGMPMAMGGAVNAPNMMQYADGGLLGMGGINKFSGLFADGGLLGLGGVNKFSGLMPFADGGLLGMGGMNKFSGLIPNFARGGMTGPLTEINVEKGELLTDKDGRIVTKYRGGGMVPHPEEGMDERGTVPAQEGMFVITKAQAKNYEKAMNNSDKLYADAIRNNISYDKAKKEAAEEQAAMTAMDKFVAKYGGAVRRMYAKGGMVPMYDLGGGTGGLNTNNPAFGSYNLPSSLIKQDIFSQDLTYPIFPSVPQSLNLDLTRPTMTTNTSMFGALGEGTYNWNNLPDSGIGYKGTDTPGTSTPGGDMSNFGKYAPYVMQGLPIAWNLMQGMKKPTKVPGDLGAMSTALEAPKMSGEAGRRALAREGAAARYAWRQAGAQAGPAALTALTNTRMGRIADFEEGLRNAQAQMDYQAAAQRKAYEQFNAQQAMNRYMLQAQADAVPTQYTAAGMGQLGQMGESILNRQALNELYPKG